MLINLSARNISMLSNIFFNEKPIHQVLFEIAFQCKRCSNQMYTLIPMIDYDRTLYDFYILEIRLKIFMHHFVAISFFLTIAAENNANNLITKIIFFTICHMTLCIFY